MNVNSPKGVATDGPRSMLTQTAISAFHSRSRASMSDMAIYRQLTKVLRVSWELHLPTIGITMACMRTAAGLLLAPLLLAATCMAQSEAPPGNIRLLPGYLHQ